MLIYNFFPIKFYFYWTILATRVYEGEIYYITRIKKSYIIKYLVNCCVLIWFILFWGGVLLLQFIKTYMLFRIPPAFYWCLGSPSGRDCQESIFGCLKQMIRVRCSLSRLFSVRRRQAHRHGLVLICVLQRRTINSQTCKRGNVTFWRIYVAISLLFA